MFAKYQEEAEKNDKVIFCGRLADYKYYDMHVVIERALEVVEKEFTKLHKTKLISWFFGSMELTRSLSARNKL